MFSCVGCDFLLGCFNVGFVDEVESEVLDFFEVVVVVEEGFKFLLSTVEPVP